MSNLLSNKKVTSYAGLSFVVLAWGLSGIASKFYLNYYSPTFGVAWTSFISAVALLVIFRKKLKNLNANYFKTALILGVFYSTANLSQKIGLQYTTPTMYAFFENLSCVVVPFLVWGLAKQKPSILQIIGSAVCLLSAFVLSGLGSASQNLIIGKGEILCAAAGIFYGVNIAGTSVYTKEFDSALYIMLILFFESIISLIASICFNFITINGAPIEVIRFSFDPLILISRIAIVLVSSALCWVIRTSSMKHVNATVVAVMMPFSSIITSAVSVLVGMDKLTSNLIIGAILGLIAMLICAAGDIASDKKHKQTI
jgi:drug/metabolite transporter (DMT)-like permease